MTPPPDEAAAANSAFSPEPSIRVIMMPKDTNAYGTIFGGVILSFIDQAGAVEAKRHGAEFIVTIAMREVVFHEPVYVGDLVSFYTRLVKVGRTSITIAVEVFSQPGEGIGNRVRVTEAEVTYVNLDKNRRPMPIRQKS
jgi:acyl-CoA thioesterase YciA